MHTLNKLDSDFHQAIMQGKLEEIISLHKQGANINAQEEKHGKSALHFAVQYRHFNIVYYLLTHGAQVDIEDIRGSTPAAYAFHEDDYEISPQIGLLLLKHGANVNGRFEVSPLLFYVAQSVYNYKMNVEVLEYILSKGAQVNAICDDDGNIQTALQQATVMFAFLSHPVKSNADASLEVIKVLLAWGADIKLTNGQKRTPLEELGGYNLPINDAKEVVKLLSGKKPAPERRPVNEDEIYKTVNALIHTAQKAIAACHQPAAATSHHQKYERTRLFWVDLERKAIGQTKHIIPRPGC